MEKAPPAIRRYIRITVQGEDVYGLFTGPIPKGGRALQGNVC
jgi:hypothetical protein